MLNRFDGRPADQWEPTTWDEYLRAEPRDFLHRLEAAAGLPAPSQVPPATPTTLTSRVLAIAATAIKSVHPIEIQPGFIDTAGYGGGPNSALDAFAAIPDDVRRPKHDDLYGEAGYRFWIVVRGREPILAFEQQAGLAWTRHHSVAFALMDLYEDSRRHLVVIALKLLRRVDHL